MIPSTAIHQFHSGSAYGDAVTNGMFLIRRLLLRFGFSSEIYVEQVAPELKGQLFSHKQLNPTESDLIFIHHSMGHDLEEWVLTLPGKKILIYHNITPASFFPEDSLFRYYSQLGRQQLKTFLPIISSAIADSKLNAQELLALGYKDVETIPLLIDINTLESRQWDTRIADASADTYTLLFVGRVAANKCQHDLITIARYLKGMIKRPFELVLVGGYERENPYYQTLQIMISKAGVSSNIRFTGKISDAELYGWYRTADVFVSMSEHEGFGVPLIEAMAFDVPVLAYKSSNIPHTLGGAGILITQKNHCEIAALIKILSEDRAMKRAIIKKQRAHAATFTTEILSQRLASFLERQRIELPCPMGKTPILPAHGPSHQIEGPFESSYSLALVNRELAFALNRTLPGSVALFATEGPGDYEPDIAAIRSIPGLESIWKKSRKKSRADVVIRNLYPPRVSDMDGQINLFYFAWEESMLPAKWVAQFNHHLDGMPVLSKFIKKILIDNGVNLPAATCGCGVDHLENIAPVSCPLTIKTKFKFLHISSCFPRKGVDVLLLAFAETFTPKDNVGLVIKTFPNIHNTVEAQVAALEKKFKNCPPIEIINKDLTTGEMAGLYLQCDALVAPSRGEGFGLPMAEAMWYGLPVITTAHGGQCDFCTDETSWLIDFSFQPARTHMNLYHSVWAEPDAHHLGHLMDEVRHASLEQLHPKLNAAKKLIKSEFFWGNCADRLNKLTQKISMTKPLHSKRPRVGWISSWNSKCGIAAYSKFLINELVETDVDIHIFASKVTSTDTPDDKNTIRCWTDYDGGVNDLLKALAQERVTVVVLQFNFAFFSTESLKQIVQFTRKHGIVSIFFFHSTADANLPGHKVSLQPIIPFLAQVDRLLVHGLDDLNRFKSWGLCANVAIFPHGVFNRSKNNLKESSVPGNIQRTSPPSIIASYGFMLPHKGLEQLIEAFARLRIHHPDIHLLMVNALYPMEVSTQTNDRCRALIDHHGLHDAVTMETDFLDNQESLALLDHATLIVFPYQATEESSSAAVRWGIATQRPVVCTPLDIFSDVKEVVHQLPGTSPTDIATGIEHLLQDNDLLNSKKELQARWLAAHDWKILGKRLHGMIKGLAVALSLP